MAKQEDLRTEILKYLAIQQEASTFSSLYEHLLRSGMIEDIREDRRTVVRMMRQLEKEGKGAVSLVCTLKKRKEQ